MRTLSIRTAFMFVLALVMSSSALAKKGDWPEVTEDGLELHKKTKHSAVYLDPEAEFSGYNSVMLMEPEVAFKKNWQRDQNRSRTARVTDKDMQDIRDRLSKEFTEVFSEVLQEDDGYAVVDAAGEDVLLLRPAIVNLDVVAPDTMDRRMGMNTYTQSAGQMTLYVEFYDSTTGDLLGKATDAKRDRDKGYMQWQTSVSNKAAARRVLKEWASALRDGLDQAHAKGD